MEDIRFIAAPPLSIENQPLTQDTSSVPGQLKLDKQGNLSVQVYRYRGSVKNVIDSWDNVFLDRVGMFLGSRSLVLPDGSRIVFEEPRFIRPFRNNDAQNFSAVSGKFIQSFADTEKLTPFEARRDESNYTSHLFVTARLVPADPSRPVETEVLGLGRIPVMLGSKLCHLHNKTVEELQDMGECPNDPFGYFIMHGAEKLIIMQQKLRQNRVVIIPDAKKNLFCQMIVMTPKGTERIKISKDPVVNFYKIHLSNFGSDNEINALLIFKMFGLSDQEEIMKYFEPFVSNRYMDRFENELSTTFGHMAHFPDPYDIIIKAKNQQVNVDNLEQIQEQIRSDTIQALFPQYNPEIESLEQEAIALFDEIQGFAQNLIPEAEEDVASYLQMILDLTEIEFNAFYQEDQDESPFQQFSRLVSEAEEYEEIINKIKVYQEVIKKMEYLQEFRLYMLASMISRLVLVNIGANKPTDRDDWGIKSVVTAGHRFAELFLQIWKTEIDRVQNNEIGKNPRIVFSTAIKSLKNIFTKPFEDSMTSGSWGYGSHARSTDGVVAPPTRISVTSLISDLTKLNKPASRQDSSTKKREMHESQLGFVCMAETPEGQNCGMLEVLALMALVTLERDENRVIDYVSRNRMISLVRTNDMDRPCWVNGRLIGWCKIRDLHSFVLDARRNGRFDYDITTVIDHNILNIHTDSGRLVRPLLRTNPEHETNPKAPRLLIDTLKDGWKARPEFLISRGYIEYVEPWEMGQIEMYQGKSRATVLIAETLDMMEQREYERAKITSDIEKYLADLSLLNQKEESGAESEERRSLEENYRNASAALAKLRNYTHAELDPSGLLGRAASLSPAPGHNAAPRNSYQCRMNSQALGFYSSQAASRFDTTGRLLAYPSEPIFQTQGDMYYNTGSNPSGHNVMLAVGIYKGYNQEDSFIISQDAVDSGLAWTIKLTKISSSISAGNHNKEYRESFTNKIPFKEAEKDKYHAITEDGTPRIGAFIDVGDCVIGKIQVHHDDPSDIRNVSEFSPPGVSGYVHRVYIGRSAQKLQIIKVTLKKVRRPVLGQKFAIRAAQKGTAGLFLPRSLMPFSDDGLTPDFIMNPHSLPKRMTMAPVIESLASMSGVLSGMRVNATAFRKFNIDEFGSVLRSYGYNSTGKHRMRSGLDGSEMTYSMYMGSSFVLTLKHQVEDKVTARGTGSRNPLTREPVKGRAKGGGVRVGEMEKDTIVAHGATGVLQDRLLKCSGAYTATLCNRCGTMATARPREGIFECKACNQTTDFGTCEIPYTLRYFQNLSSLAWLKVSMKMKSVPSATPVNPTEIKSEMEANQRQRTGIQDSQVITQPIQIDTTQIRETPRFMTNFERIRVLGARVNQLSQNAEPLVPVEGLTNALDIAKKELEAGVIPFIIRRTLPDGKIEEWKVSELPVI